MRTTALLLALALVPACALSPWGRINNNFGMHHPEAANEVLLRRATDYQLSAAISAYRTEGDVPSLGLAIAHALDRETIREGSAELIRQGKIQTGMLELEVVATWGQPYDTSSSVFSTTNGAVRVGTFFYGYRGDYSWRLTHLVSFTNGIVDGWSFL